MSANGRQANGYREGLAEDREALSTRLLITQYLLKKVKAAKELTLNNSFLTLKIHPTSPVSSATFVLIMKALDNYLLIARHLFCPRQFVRKHSVFYQVQKYVSSHVFRGLLMCKRDRCERQTVNKVYLH